MQIHILSFIMFILYVYAYNPEGSMTEEYPNNRHGHFYRKEKSPTNEPLFPGG